MTITITEQSPCVYSVHTNSQLTGASPSIERDTILTKKLNSTWSIPVTLSFALSDLSCRLNNVLSPLNYVNSCSAFHSYKPQPYLLTSKTMRSEKAKAEKKKDTVVVLELGPAVQSTELIFTRESNEGSCESLLTSFGEVDPYYKETSTIGKTRAQPRPKPEPNQLTSMDMMSAELDLDKGRNYADNSLNSMRPLDAQRMSLLESARVHMKQSIGAAHAVGLASHQPHLPPGGPMRHNSYTMGFDPPMPYDPNMPASIQFPDPLAFGKGKAKKGRAKKNSGEESVAPTGRGKGSRKGRGASAVGATGGRKSTGIVPENPFGMDQMRPPLQRSFSDFPGQMNQQMNQYQQMQQMQQMHQYQQNQQFQQSQQYRMQMQQHQMPQNQMQSPQPTGMAPLKNQLGPNYTDQDSDEEYDPPPPPKPQVSASSRSSVPPPQQLGNPMVGYPGMPLQSPNHLPLTPSPLSAAPKPFSPEQQHFGMKMRENAYWKELDRLDQKPDIEKLKKQVSTGSMNPSVILDEQSSSSSTGHANTESSEVKVLATDASIPAPPTSKLPISAPTPKKKLGLEAAISKIRGQQEQALQKQQQQLIQQQESIDSSVSQQPTPQPLEQSSAQSMLATHQLNRARNLNDVFDDEVEEGNSVGRDVKPSLSALQRALSSSQPDSSTSDPSSLYNRSSQSSAAHSQSLKKESAEDEPEKEKEKLILKIPKILKTGDDRKDERKEKERDRSREGDRERDRDRSEKSKEDRNQRDKEKKEKDRDRRRQRERDRAEQKRVDRDKEPGKDKEQSSSSKKRKLDRKDEKDRREPDRKKERMMAAIMKNTVDEDKKDVKEEFSTSGPSTSSESTSRKETSAAPITRKESTSTASSIASLQRKESFTSQSSSFPIADHHREPSKKKPLPPPSGPPPGTYSGPPNVGSIPSSSRGNNGGIGNRKQAIPPPAQIMRGPPSDQMYRERTGSMRGFPPSSHYHGSGGSGGSKQVASYAQGLPPGMGPPAVKPHGNNYQASQWVRPPTHRDTHSYHGMPSLGPPQLQREPPPPLPQMIPLPREPLPRDPPALREQTRERGSHRGGDEAGGPDSPEEGTLRIDDE
uniref:Trithorax group protein osa n=1 Tax=Caenorhabditis tropicalis TaxID=1561998 RepID=A0A1I7TKM4_9PELO